MADSLKRRDFIKTASLLGASFIIANPLSEKSFPLFNKTSEIKNDYFTVSFDQERGTINIYRSSGTPLITGGTSCINLPSGQAGITTGKRSIASAVYKNTLDSASFRDQLGSGKKLIIFSKDLGEYDRL